MNKGQIFKFKTLVIKPDLEHHPNGLEGEIEAIVIDECDKINVKKTNTETRTTKTYLCYGGHKLFFYSHVTIARYEIDDDCAVEEDNDDDYQYMLEEHSHLRIANAYHTIKTIADGVVIKKYDKALAKS